MKFNDDSLCNSYYVYGLCREFFCMFDVIKKALKTSVFNASSGEGGL